MRTQRTPTGEFHIFDQVIVARISITSLNVSHHLVGSTTRHHYNMQQSATPPLRMTQFPESTTIALMIPCPTTCLKAVRAPSTVVTSKSSAMMRYGTSTATPLSPKRYIYYFKNGWVIKESPALRRVVVGRLQHPDILTIQQFSEAGLEVLRWVRGFQ